MTTAKQKYDASYVVDTRPLCAGMPFLLTEAAHPRMVLKNGSHFMVMDEQAQIPACNSLGYGYYRFDTRHLSQWEMTLNGQPLSLLSSDVKHGYSGRFLYTNPQLDGIPQQKITIERELVVSELLWENLRIENYGPQSYEIELSINFQSDFADMFEVRGLNRGARGERMLPSLLHDNSAMFLAYRGRDGVLLETIIEFNGIKPASISDAVATFKLQLPLRGLIELSLCIITRIGGQEIGKTESEHNFRTAKQAADEHYQQWRRGTTQIDTANKLFDLSLGRSIDDIYILRQPTPKGFGLAAGLPWYAAVFGRDSAVTALQALPFMPQVARETIEVLAAYQGQKSDVFKVEESGKIMHELRLGELARIGQIPHSPYYGTVDATQLWIMLLCQYFNWTGDLEFVAELWPAVKAAVGYLDKEADQGGGYIFYHPSPGGLINQGWKDSDDSIMHTDGMLAEAPIAVAEAQAYLYAARIQLAHLAEVIGQRQFSKKLRSDAELLKDMFQKDFWMTTERYVCLALDAHRHQVSVISSNAGHALWSGILDDDKAHAVADRLMKPDMYSGWGVRTLSNDVVAYNPVSYHNGSVWPHDNAIICEGMRLVGRGNDMLKIMDGIVAVSLAGTEHRLPEVFCGFDRVGSLKPVDYPVSCSPQAWAAGSLLHMIKTCLNFQPDAINRCLKIVDPALPEWIGNISIRGLKIGNATLDIAFESQHGSTYAKVLRKTGALKVIVEN